jgi:hypothetical protein
LDSSVAIAAERRGDTVQVSSTACSGRPAIRRQPYRPVGVVELIHAIHAETPERQARREAFVEELLRGGRLSV